MSDLLKHNVFIRKFEDKTILMTVVDTKDFEPLFEKSEHNAPDFLIGACTMTNELMGGLPVMTLNVHTDFEEITNQTKGFGIGSIMTGRSARGPIWAYKRTSLEIGPEDLKFFPLK